MFICNAQECKITPQKKNISSNEPLFYSYSVKISKCSGNCNYINNPYGKVCVPNVVKNIHVKVFDLELIKQGT